MIDYLRKPVRAVIRNLAILPSVDPNRLLPLGGATGQFPMKASDEDGDIVWADYQVDDELSLDSEFPVQNKVLASEIYQLQSQLDGIPFPSSDNPLMDGEADPGDSPDFARADHRHPSDTSKADVADVPTKMSDLNNDSGFITAADVPEEVFWANYGTTTYSEIGTALTAGKLVMCEYSGIYYTYHYRAINTRYFASEGGYWLSVTSGNVWSQGQSSGPSAATATPLMDGVGAVGSSSKYAKEDHVHPSDTSKAAKDIFLTATLSGTTVSVASISPFTSASELANYADGIVWLKYNYTAAEAWIIPLINAYEATLEVDDDEETSCYFTFGGAVYTDSAPTVYSVVFEGIATDATSMSGTLQEMSSGGSSIEPYTSNPAMDGTASAGSSTSYAKGDHVHPSDTSKITMPSGGSVGQVLKKTANGTEWANESGSGGAEEVFWAEYGTTTYSEIGAALTAGKLVMCEYGGIYYSYRYRMIDTRYFTSEGGYWITVTSGNVWAQGQELPPSAATDPPLMDSTAAAAGSSARYAREDHIHPTDTSRLAANQGSGNAGKFLVVGSDGVVTPVTMATWQGGNY